MAEKDNATCKICGKPYYACLSCADAMKLHPWKTYCCSSDCYKVFQVIRGFSTGVYTKEEAKEKLQNIDLGNIEFLRPHIKDIIENVLREEKNEDNIAELIIETESAITKEVKEIEEIEEEVSAVSMVAPSRKKKFKVEIE